jgi:hypothetical protein
METEIATFDARQAAPWTLPEYERVRQAAMALVRSHGQIDLPVPGGRPRIATTVDGPLLWALMGALDRTRAWEES